MGMDITLSAPHPLRFQPPIDARLFSLFFLSLPRLSRFGATLSLGQHLGLRRGGDGRHFSPAAASVGIRVRSGLRFLTSGKCPGPCFTAGFRGHQSEKWASISDQWYRQLFNTVGNKSIAKMDDSGQRENGRHKADHYKSIHAQWMIPQHQMKDNQALKLMTVMAERDNAIQERNIALSEKKAALAERDMAILQRDAAIAERNTAIMERDNAIAALEYARENGMNGSGVAGCPPGCTAPRGAKHIHHHHSQQHQQHLHAHSGLPPTQLANDPYNHSREMHATDAHPNSTASEGIAKSRKVKRPRKDTKPLQCQAQATAPPKKTKPRKSKRSCGGDDLNKQATFVKPLNDWRSEMGGNVENLNKQGTKHHNEWKDQDLGLNQVTFDESTMPVPVCSCTGKYQPCYKWGNGGWQSACCTTTLSMYPLPVMPNKRHARVGGRKMSGTVFTRILSRLAADGHDLSVPVDLKDHWAKHGTNRYITIR